MAQSLTIHRFGANHGADDWSAVPALIAYEGQRPSADELASLLTSAGGPVALVAAGRARPDDVNGAAASDADVTVVVADAEAATGGRGSADLAGVLWQSFPAVASLLNGSLLDVGAVVLASGGIEKLGSWRPGAGDPVTLAVSEVVARGGSLRAVLVPGESDAALATVPPELAPVAPPASRRWLMELIQRTDVRRLLGSVASPSDAAAVTAGLLLWHDFLDESHAVSQSVEGQGRRHAGDYWHAIMHRRESDFGNAKYWFRRVGHHPVFESLAARAERLAVDSGAPGAKLVARLAPGGKWDPVAFVDACSETARSPDAAAELLLRRFQADEMLLLLWETCQDARG